MFTANEMVTAIANRPELDADLEDRFERASFAGYLAAHFGSRVPETAAKFIEDLDSSHTLFEGDRVREWFFELQLFRTCGDD